MGRNNANQQGTEKQSRSQPDADPNEKTQVLPAIDESFPRNVVVELPVGPDGGYVTRGFRRDLPYEHAAICRRVINQLNADGVRLADGTPIERPDDVLCFVLEQVRRGMNPNPEEQADARSNPQSK